MSHDDENLIRDLIQRWVTAVDSGDPGALDTIVADHADDIVMFDVPPPYEGVRGLDAYRETWPAFLRWQANGSHFEVVDLEVTAGADVAFAFALLKCGTDEEFANDPEQRMRLTIGLRKVDGRWTVAHEHHSFPDIDDRSKAENEIRAIQDHWSESTAAKDLDGIVSHLADDIVSYEHDTPLQYVGAKNVREVCAKGMEYGTGDVSFTVPEMRVESRYDLAVAWGLNRMTFELPDGSTGESWSRGTRVFRRIAGEWKMVHQHVSYPYEPETGEAKIDLTP